MPRVRLHVREAQSAEDPPGAGLRPIAARQTVVQTGREHRRPGPDDRRVVPVQPAPDAAVRRPEDRSVVACRVGVPAVFSRVVVGQQRLSRLPVDAAAASPDDDGDVTAAAAVARGTTARARRRSHRRRRRRVFRPAVRRDGNHRQQPRPLRAGPSVHLLRQSVLKEVRSQDSHQVLFFIRDKLL